MTSAKDGEVDLKEKVASLEAELNTAKAESEFKAQVASLLKVEAEDLTADKVASLIKEKQAVEGEAAKLTDRIAALETERKTEKAEAWVQTLVDSGKIATDRMASWTERYMRNPEDALEAAKDLRATLVDTADAKVEHRIASANDEELKAFIEEAF